MTPNIDLLASRIEAKIVRDVGCWVWRGASSGRTARYRHASIGIPHSRRSALVTRVMWELQYGEIPPGLCVLHKCDNPLCVNPQHLFLGTQADNMRDMQNKRRSTFGEKSRRATLASSQVEEIRNSDEPHVQIAKRLGATYGQVCAIRHGRGWPNVPMPDPPVKYRHAPRTQSPETRARISATRIARGLNWRNPRRLTAKRTEGE